MDRKYRWQDLYNALDSVPKDKLKKYHEFFCAIEDDADCQLFIARLLFKLEKLKGVKEPENKNIIGAVMRKLKSLDIIDVFGWSLLALSAGITVMLFKDVKRSAEAHRRILDQFAAIVKDVNNELLSM